MKKLIFTAFLVFSGAFALLAQEDSASFAAKMHSENAAVLRQYAAHPSVVAKKVVPRGEAYLYFNHLDWMNLSSADAAGGAGAAGAVGGAGGVGAVGGAGGAGGADTPVVPVADPAELYFTRNGNVLFSSKDADSIWSAPAPPSDLFENAGRESYPVVTYNGRALYFSSRSLYGIGGYDIYRCDRDPVTGALGTPQNLGYPFNSEADDILCSETPDGKYIMFASSRDCGPGQICIYVVEYENFTRRAASASEVASLLKMNPGPSSGNYTFAKGSLAGDLPVVFAESEPVYGLTVSEEGSFAEDNELPGGIVYQIQIYVVSKPVSIKQLKGISPVYDHKVSGSRHLYAAGLFRSYSEAKAALTKVKGAGFPSALIIAYRDGKSLSVNRARQLESDTVIQEEVRIVK